jgi:ribonuclease J
MKITPVGGYEEFGRNMTAFEVAGETILIDMGIRLDRVLVHEDTEISKMPYSELIRLGIAPDDSVVKKDTVRAIVLSHGHLDHIGAVPFLAAKYNVPIVGTPYTISLIERELGRKSDVPLYTLEEGGILQITPKMTVEFINMTHSIPQTVMVAVHTPEGIFLYANDFKMDDTPVLGKKPDYDRIREVGKEGVKCLVIETTRVDIEGRTPSERIARELLKENLLKSDEEKGLIVTTFSSHVARVSSITEIASTIGRIPVLLGRSMEKYSSIAEELKIMSLPENTRVYGKGDAVTSAIHRIMKDGKEKYLLLTTGHQGEPDAILSRIADGKLPFRIEKGDEVVFSADVIPNPINVSNRYSLETKMKLKGARIFKGVHVSGHACREDHLDLLKMVQPENIIPCHGDLKMLATYGEMASEEGYELHKNLFLIRNGKSLKL